MPPLNVSNQTEDGKGLVSAFATPSVGTVANTGNVFLDALVWGDKWTGVTISWAFDNSLNVWSAPERAAFETAFGLFEAVANITFDATETANSDAANLEFFSSNETNSGALGEHFGPNGQGNQGDGTYYPSSHGNWLADIAQGGYAFLTILHELGHGLGLAHPHDDGGGSGVFPGVDGTDGNGDPIGVGQDTGTNGRNTGLFTVMSYNDIGEWWAPGGEQNFGFQGGLMAFDIAALQHIYGTNTTYRTGSDTYVLADANAAGTFYSTIWDAGGQDTISYAGAGAAVIDLRAATLTGPEAGGFLSRVGTTLGGFTIANGVVIENATSGSGNDLLTGNAARNTLDGGAGVDRLFGNNGDDLLIGGQGADELDGGNGTDIASYVGSNQGVAIDLEAGTFTGGHAQGDIFISIEGVTGSGHADTLRGDSVENQFHGAAGADSIEGRAGNDILRGGLGADTLNGGFGNDTMYGADTDLILNGSFEGASLDRIVKPNGWTTPPDFVEGWGNLSRISREFFTQATGVAPVDGRFGLDLEVDASGNAQITQQITAAEDGQSYRIAFDIRKLNLAADAKLEVYWAGTKIAEFLPGTDWATQSIVVVGGQGAGGTKNQLLFREVGGVDLHGTLLDNVRMFRIGGIHGDGEDPFLDGNDSFVDGRGADAIFGHGGDDTATFSDLTSISPWDAFDGGAGTDRLVVDWSAADGRIIYEGYNVTNSPVIGVAESFRNMNGDDRIFFKNVESIDFTGSAFDDQLRGTYGADVLRGGAGNDMLIGGGGRDTLNGGSGFDQAILKFDTAVTINKAVRDAAATQAGYTFSGGIKLILIESISLETGEGADEFDLRGTLTTGTGPSSFNSGGGDDTFKVDLANSDTAYFDGGRGIDLLVMDWSAATTAIAYFDNHVQGLQWGYRTGPIPGSSPERDFSIDFRGVERLELYGGLGNDDLRGFGRDDRINAGLGRDDVQMGEGSDTLVLDWQLVARDRVYGTSSLGWHSFATVDYGEATRLTGSLAEGYSGAFSFWADTWNPNPPAVTGYGDDRVDFTGVEHFHLTLGPGGDAIATGDGDDTIIGNGGSDLYITGKGVDIINAGGGNARWEADKSDATVGMTIDLNAPEFSYVIGGRTGTASGIQVLGSDVDHRFQSGKGNDVITTTLNGGDDFIQTNAGQDTVESRGGFDRIAFGGGSDLLIVDYGIMFSNSVTSGALTGAAATGFSGQVTGDLGWGVSFTGVERFDLRMAKNGNHTLVTGGGDDIVKLNLGRSTVDMGRGSDLLRVDLSLISFAITGSLTSGVGGYAGLLDTNSTGIPGSRVEFTGVDRFDLKLGGGNDDIVNGLGADMFDGGGGIDILRYAGRLRDYAITVDLGTVSVTRNGITDTVRNFEELRFADGSRAFGDIHTANTTTRGVLVIGTRLTGAIDYTNDFGGDQDWLSVTLVAGQTYEFTMKTVKGSTVDPHIIGLYKGPGAPLASTTDDNGGGGLNAKITHTADMTGIYYLSVGGGGTTVGGYSVLASAVASPLRAVQAKVTAPESGQFLTSAAVADADCDQFQMETAGMLRLAPDVGSPTTGGLDGLDDQTLQAQVPDESSFWA